MYHIPYILLYEPHKFSISNLSSQIIDSLHISFALKETEYLKIIIYELKNQISNQNCKK